MSRIVRLLTFVSRGECLKLPDSDKVHVVPMQLFRTKNSVILRIGDTTYWFDHDGLYDGPEMTFPEGISEEKSAEIGEKLGACVANRGRAPDKAYFHEDCDGGDAETAEWPADRRPS